ncbi:MAG: hypothetical protein WDN09_02475 [bacterium]
MKISNGMNRNKLSKQLAALVFFIFIANTVSQRFYWYTSIWYFDMFMHFISGFWLGLAFSWLWWPRSGARGSKLLAKIAVSVFVIGLSWEVFEYFFYNVVDSNTFNPIDTVSDLCFDLAGGFTALWYLRRSLISDKENAIIS